LWTSGRNGFGGFVVLETLEDDSAGCPIDGGGTQGLPMRVDCPTQTPGTGNRQHQQIAGWSKLQTDIQDAAETLRTIADDRWKPRFKMETDITISSRNFGLLKGRTVDISESGVAAMLTNEVLAGEIVELSFMLPHGTVTVCATVRQKNAFRYGFEFVDLNSVNEVVRRTCRDLSVDQSLFAGLKMWEPSAFCCRLPKRYTAFVFAALNFAHRFLWAGGNLPASWCRHDALHRQPSQSSSPPLLVLIALRPLPKVWCRNAGTIAC
jgi:PilZ domain